MDELKAYSVAKLIVLLIIIFGLCYISGKVIENL